MRSLLRLLFFALFLAPLAALAVNPGEALSDPALEARAHAVSAELRCLVCQNQSINDSDAELAHELRVLVRERISAGDTDTQARQYIVDRYGEFVLLRPVFALHTLLLWIAAPIILLAGLVAIVIGLRRHRGTMPAEGPVALTPEEKAALLSLEDSGKGH